MVTLEYIIYNLFNFISTYTFFPYKYLSITYESKTFHKIYVKKSEVIDRNTYSECHCIGYITK